MTDSMTPLDGSLRTITQAPPVAPSRMHDGRPVLEPDAGRPWASRVVLNPAAVLVDDGGGLGRLIDAWGLADDARRRLAAAGGACVMLFRAQGAADPRTGHAASSLGLAVFTPELELVWRRPDPVLGPDAPFQNLGVEDPRCTKVGDDYYLYYTGYWAPEAQAPPEERRVHICLATTRDFVQWDVHGPVEGNINDVANKNAALLPEPVGGRWLLLHRPMEGPDAMTIHLAESESPAGPWHSLGRLVESHPYREFARSWIGAGGPPLALGEGRFVAIYHQGHFTPEGAREYDLAAALFDFEADHPVRGRIEPLMRPEGSLEQQGDAELGVDNVLFSCANYRWQGDLIIPYAGADSRIFGARIDERALVEALEASGASAR